MNKWIWIVSVLLMVSLCGCNTAAGQKELAARDAAYQANLRVTHPVLPDAGALCEQAFSAPVVPGEVETPILVALKTTWQPSASKNTWSNTLARFPFIGTGDLADVRSLVCILEDKVEAGKYCLWFDPGCPNPLTGYRYDWQVRVVSLPAGNVVAGADFQGEEPSGADLTNVSGPPESAPPERQFYHWIFDELGLGDGHIQWIPTSPNVLVLSPDGNTIAVGAENGSVSIWQLNPDEMIYEHDGSFYDRPITTLGYAPDGKITAVRGADAGIAIVDMVSGSYQIIEYPNFYDLSAFTLSPDGSLLAVETPNNTLTLWNVGTEAVIQTLNGREGVVRILAISPQNDRIAAVWDDTVALWEIGTGEKIGSFSMQNENITVVGSSPPIESIAFSRDGRLFAAGMKSVITVYDLQARKIMHQFTEEGSQINPISCIDFSPEGNMLVFGSGATLEFWDLNEDKIVRTLTGHLNTIHQCAFLPDGIQLVSTGADNTLKLWDLE